MIIDDNATTSSSFSVHHGVLKVDQPVHAQRNRRSGVMRRRHSVDFKPTSEPEVREVEKLDPECRTVCWYSKDEYEIIKARNSLIVKMMKTGHFKESDDHSFRGLEHKLKEGFKQRRANKFNALNAVLEEQDRQVAVGVLEPEKIARQYRRVSLNAAETALVVGMRDAEESLAYKPQPSHEENDCSEMTPSLQNCDDSYGNISTDVDTISSEDSGYNHPEQQTEIVRLEVRGLFAAASLMKRGSGRMGRRSSM